MQAGPDGLRDAGACGPLRLVKKSRRNLDGDFARFIHDSKLYHIEDHHRVWCFDSESGADVCCGLHKSPETGRWAGFYRRFKLFREDNPNRGAFLILLRFDAHHVAAQAQRAVGRAVDAGIVELNLQFGLQLRAVIQVDERAMQS